MLTKSSFANHILFQNILLFLFLRLIATSFNYIHLKHNYLTKNIDEILLFLVLLYFSLAYFPFAFSNIALIVLVLVFLVYSFSKRKNSVKKINLRYLLLIVIPVFIISSFVFHTSDYSFFFSKLLQKSPTFLVPVVIIPFLQKKKQLKYFAIVFVSTSVLVVFVNLFRLTNLYFVDQHLTRYLFEKASIIQHLYFGVYQLVALVFLLEFHKVFFHKSLVYILFILLSIGVIISTSRISYLLYLLIVTFYLFKFFNLRKAFISVFTIGGLFLTMIFTIPQVKEKFAHSLNPTTSPRLIIWKNSYLVLKNSGKLVQGVGLDYYKNTRGTYWLKGLTEQENYEGIAGFNSHNQYLEFILLSGILGLLFVFLMLFTLYKALVLKDVFILSLVSILFLFSFVENILSRQWGIILFSVLMAIIYSRYNQKTKDWIN